MASAVQEASGFQELLERGEDGPYAFAQMFSTDGWGARRRSKNTFKLLKKIDLPLRKMLREGERVFFVTRGVAQPSILEWYFLGAALYYMNQRAVVLTNQRILLLQIDSRRNPREMRGEIAYAAVSRLENSWTGSLRIEFHSGDRVLLAGVPKADRKWLATTFGRLLEGLETPPVQSELENLCPHCYVIVEGQPARCPACGGRFKSPKTAGLLSLVFPGAGDLYLGHTGFALLEILGATALWLVVIALAVAPDVGVLEAVIFAGILVVFAHGIDAYTTYRIARKGVLPDAGRPVGRRYLAAAVLPLLAVATLVASAPSKTRLRPAPSVVAGETLTPEHLAALQNAGHLEPGEAVRYFYSAGPSTILQHGSLITSDRMVSYEVGYEVDFRESARFEEVVDLHVYPSVTGEPFLRFYVVREDGSAFPLLVGTEGDGEGLFIEELTRRWYAARESTDGYWFDGGAGRSEGDAVIVRGAGDPIELESARRWWLSVWFGEEDAAWTIVDRVEQPDGSVVLELEVPDEGNREVYFGPPAA